MPKNLSVTSPIPLGTVNIPVDGDPMNAAHDLERLMQDVLNMMAGSIATATPIGTVLPFAGLVAPTGWLLCNGQSLSRSTYAALFAALGTVYGAQSADTFKLPDLRGRTVIGAGQYPGLSNRQRGDVGGEESHPLTTQELPNHTHQAPTTAGAAYDHAGDSSTPTYEVPTAASVSTSYDYGLAAPTSSTGGNLAHNTMPPYLVLNYIIRTGL